MNYSLDSHAPQLKDGAWVADNAVLIGRIILEARSSIWFNCVLRGDNEPITIGEGSNIQDGSVLHTDVGIPLTVGRDCTVGHMVMLHGCTIGDNTLVGIKSVILNKARIGKNSLVGANSLVTEGKQFPDGVLIMGSPAKVVRELNPQEIQFLKLNAEHYVQNAERFRTQLKRLP
jgi:carbonic anhydrase/acetyltransferase-like protein (isoleucine patch superfamily)